MADWLVYGAYGYTGRLISTEAVSRGLSPVVAGRDPDRLASLADDLGLVSWSFDLDGDLASRVGEFDAVLNCAGPFVDTSGPLVAACLEAGTDYLDVTGEPAVFARLAGRDDEASAAGVTLLPGVGFEVVVADCLAATLAARHPQATELAIGISKTGSFSGGTLRTVIRLLGDGGLVRRDDRLLRVPAADDVRQFDFGDGPTSTVAAPLGSVVTTAYSTNVETVGIYVDLPEIFARIAPLVAPLEAIFRLGPVERGLECVVTGLVDGPDEREREDGEVVVVAEVTGGERTERARLRSPETYTLTADAAASAVERTLAGDATAGFQTPATAFGPDFVTRLEGVDVEFESAGRR